MICIIYRLYYNYLVSNISCLDSGNWTRFVNLWVIHNYYLICVVYWRIAPWCFLLWMNIYPDTWSNVSGGKHVFGIVVLITATCILTLLTPIAANISLVYEPIMLLFSPIILFCTSQIFSPLFYLSHLLFSTNSH